MKRLQKVQNAAARLVTKSKKRDHITPVLVSLHWLPVEFRCQYKLLANVYSALHGPFPDYLKELIVPYVPARTLRSQSSDMLTVPKTRTITYGARCFDHSAATLWNELPFNLRKCDSLTLFKSRLKTHLFKRAFDV